MDRRDIPYAFSSCDNSNSIILLPSTDTKAVVEVAIVHIVVL